MRGIVGVVAIVIAAIVSACTPPDDSFGNPADGYPDASHEIANGTDWSNAKSVVVDLTEFGFSPETLVFRIGQPYALSLINRGSVPHRFVASEFFRAIAARSLLYADAESSYPALEGIALEPREMKTLYFVPVIAGDYHLSCDRPLHSMLGMTGHILIE